MRNVFEVLTSRAKGSSTGRGNSKTTPVASKGAYTTCPICQRTIPLNFADAHVSVCLASPPPPQPPTTQQPHPKQQQRGPAASPAHKVPSPSPSHTPQTHAQPQPHDAPTASKPPARPQSQPQAEAPKETPQAYQPAPHPIQPASRPKEGIAGASTALAAERPTPQVAPVHLEACETQTRRLQPAPSLQPAASQGPTCSQTAGRCAFDLMRQSQLRAAARCQTFFLERTP
ncbi:hypothetical protein Agub_g10075, partial [Astrephomene gubernaculifera]